MKSLPLSLMVCVGSLQASPYTRGQVRGMMYNKTLGRELWRLVMCVDPGYKIGVFIGNRGAGDLNTSVPLVICYIPRI
jgi:hypothetical protein